MHAFRLALVAACLTAASVPSGGFGQVLAQTLGQQRQAPQSRAELQFSLAPIVKQAAPAVVSVYAARVERRQSNPLAEDPFFRRFFGGDFGVPQERVQRSLGSGVIVEPSGVVVTNNHVVENMTELKVQLSDRREMEAEILLRDPRTDLAVLKLKGSGPFPVMPIGDSDALEVGDFVIAIGNPFGVGQTVTQGIVSALARSKVGIGDYQFFIQTDAAINPGNSGGALVDMAGRLVGINTAIFSRSGGSMGIGFAVPAAMVKVVVQSARDGGKLVRRPYFGAKLQAVTAEIAESIGLERPAGALVAAVTDKGPAADAGLKRGDVILSVDGQSVDDPDGFGYRFATRPIGGTASLSVQRGKQKLVMPVKLTAAPELKPRDPVKLSGVTPFTGATVVNLSPAVAEELSVDADQSGVVITEIDENSTAARVGFRKGDVVVAVNGETVKTSKDLDTVLKARVRAWQLTITRGGQTFTTVIGG
jgi:Do/DeqQ family serine protease